MEFIHLTQRQLALIESAAEEAVIEVSGAGHVDFSTDGYLTVHRLKQLELYRLFVLVGDACGPTFAMDLAARAEHITVPNVVRFRGVLHP